jgi:hypothetical protein
LFGEGDAMIYDVLEVFRKEYEGKGDKLILDNYALKEEIIIVSGSMPIKHFMIKNHLMLKKGKVLIEDETIEYLNILEDKVDAR